MRPFPGSAYTDAAVFARERARIFERAWICVGRAEEVALPGQFVRAVVGASQEPIVVVRGEDLELRAFFDVCRHRGASVVGRAECGRIARFACPYHGWTYSLAGRGDSADLVRASVEAWAGFLFVSLDGTASLRDFMGETPPWLRALPPLKLGRRSSTPVANANWKLLVENFQESHHFPHIHRALEALTPMRDAETWRGSGRWLGGTMEIAQAETVSKSGKLNDRPLIGPPARVHDAMLFPCLLTSLQPDYLLVYRLTPLTPDKTRIDFDIWFHPAANTDDPAVYELWDQINAEDRAICEDQQVNASSRAFDPVTYDSVEEGVEAFDALVTKAMSDD